MRDTGNVRSNPSEILGVGSRSSNEVGYRDDYESHANIFFGKKNVSRISTRCQQKWRNEGFVTS